MIWQIERNGILVDAAVLAKQSHIMGQKIMALEAAAYELAGQPFNLASPKQLAEILFEKQGLPVKKKTPSGGPSTDEEVLSELALDYPLPKLLLEHRSLSKLKGTYTDKLPRMVNAQTGRVHTHFAQASVVTGRLASIHFAATEWAASNLRREGVPEASIAVTGNTGIDAVLYVAEALEDGRLPRPDWPALDPSHKLIVVTAHRRESFGAGIQSLCEALRDLAACPGIQMVFPVHPNPIVRDQVHSRLSTRANVKLVVPFDYLAMQQALADACLVLTDSGGLQEEAPTFAVPLLVLREETERPEAVEAGCARLVGTDRDGIVAHVNQLIRDEDAYRQMQRQGNPFGDGAASQRIVTILKRRLSAMKRTSVAAA